MPNEDTGQSGAGDGHGQHHGHHGNSGGQSGGSGNNSGGSGATHRSGSLPMSPAEALRRAADTSSWQPGMCENFVASMYGAVGLGGYGSAADQWAGIPGDLKHSGTDAPPGALVFWGGGYGHVAISAGGGYVYTTDFSGDGKVSLVKASDITAGWGKPVSGWSQPYWGGHTVKIKGDAGDPPPEAGAGAGGGGASGGQHDDLSRQQMARRYGMQMSFLKAFPELWHLFKQATAHDWSESKFIAKFHNTDWFQNHSANWREAARLRVTDHASYQNEVDKVAGTLADTAAQMGVNLSDGDLHDIAKHIYNLQLNDSQIRDIIAGHVHRVDGSFVGAAGDVEDSINQYARQMGIRVSGQWTKKAVQGMASGDWSDQQISDHIKKMAVSAFPTFEKEIKGGQTVQDIADPYIQSMSSILELNPATLDVFNHKIRQALTARGEDGTPKPTSLYDFETQLRSDPRWLQTKNGTDSVSSGFRQVLQDMGLGW